MESEYRVIERDGWFSPQMSYLVRGQIRWFALNRDGYFADPWSWNTEPGDSDDAMMLLQSREAADAAIVRAMRINTRTG